MPVDVGGGPSDVRVAHPMPRPASTPKQLHKIDDATRFMRALRLAESGVAEGKYGQIAGVVRNVAKVGAYGIAADDWPDMAAGAGLAGARWQDPRAQNTVVHNKVSELFDKYRDWRLVAIAWKVGEAGADRIADFPELLNTEPMGPVAAYASQVMTFAAQGVGLTQQPGTEDVGAIYDADLSTLQPRESGGTQPASRAGDILRRRLYAMRDRVRNQAASEEVPGEVEPDQDVDDLRKSGVTE